MRNCMPLARAVNTKLHVRPRFQHARRITKTYMNVRLSSGGRCTAACHACWTRFSGSEFRMVMLASADQAMQIAPEIRVVLVAFEQFRARPDRADRHRLRGVSRCPPVETGLAGHHAPQRVLRRVAEVPIELVLVHDRLAQVNVELEAGKMLRDQLGERL